MKTEKKRLGTKAKIKAEKERERRIATAIFSALILLIVIVSAYTGYYFLNPQQNENINLESSEPKAAIVDQLSLTFPNPTFVETATNILKQANYTVDYYSGEQVKVELYSNLPKYKIIILRVHSSTTEEGQTKGPLALFTSEPYSNDHSIEQLTDQLCRVAYSREESEKGIAYFGVSPPFVTQSMGKFNNTIIVMMGCEGLENPSMAKAFIEKGAKAVIGWNASVSASRTDTTTISLLQNLIVGKQTIKYAVENAMKEVGPDIACDSVLTYYPAQAEKETIQSIS